MAQTPVVPGNTVTSDETTPVSSTPGTANGAAHAEEEVVEPADVAESTPPSDQPAPEAAHLADRFRDHLRAQGSPPQTFATYRRIAVQFFDWAAKNNVPIAELPPDAPEQFYKAAGLAPNNPQRNIWSSALRAVERWSLSQNIGIPKLDYPPTVAPMKGRKKIVSGSKTTPMTPTMSGPMPGAHPMTPDADVGNTGSIGNIGNVVSLPGATPYRGVFSDVPPAAPPPPINRLAQPGAAQIRRGRVPAAQAIMPQGGTLRVLRESDGTDGNAPGKRVVIGDYDETDLQGYTDLHGFVQSVVHPNLQPLRAAKTAKYVCQSFDQWGRASGAPAPVVIVNTGAASGPVLPSLGVDDPFAAKLAALEERTEKALKVVEEKAKDGSANPLMVQMWLHQIREDGRRERDRIEAEMRRGGGFGGLDVNVRDAGTGQQIPATLNPIDVGPFEGLAKILQSMGVAEIIKSKSTPPEKQPDAFALMKSAKELFGKPDRGGPDDVATTLMQAQIKRLEDSNAELMKKLSEQKAPTWREKMEEMEYFDRLIERRTGGGPSSWEVLFEKLPEVVNAFGGLVERYAAGKLKASGSIKNESAGVGTPPPTPPQKQQLVVPGPVKNALFTLRDAKRGEHETIINAVYALVGELLSAGEPWNGFAKALYEELKTVDTPEEIAAIVVKVFRTLGMKVLLTQNPQMVSIVTETLVKHFGAFTEQLYGEARVLGGVAVDAGTTGAQSEEPPKESPVAEPPIDQSEAQRIAALGGYEPRIGDDGEEEEDEESDDSEDDGSGEADGEDE